jgi:hypothetical protein
MELRYIENYCMKIDVGLSRKINSVLYNWGAGLAQAV